jgi:hypothetical protein
MELAFPGQILMELAFPGQILMELAFPGQIFEQYSNIVFHENPSSGSQVVPCGRTDWHEEATNRFSQVCERV